MEGIIDSMIGINSRKHKKPSNAIQRGTQAGGGSGNSYLSKFQALKEEEEFQSQNAHNVIPLEVYASSILVERIYRDVQSALVSAPNINYYRILADICKHTLDLSSEIQFIRLAIHIYPKDRSLKQRLASSLTKSGIEFMSLAAKNNNDQTFYHLATAQFNEALKFNKEDSNCFAYKAVCHIRLGENSKALETVDKAICFNTDSKESEKYDSSSSIVDLYILRAKLYQAEGLIEKCLEDMKTATYLNPHHLEVIAFNSRTIILSEKYYKLGMSCYENNDYNEAIKHFEDGLLINPVDLKMLLMLSRVHRIIGSLVIAFNYIGQAENVYEVLSEKMLPIPFDIQHQRNLIYNDFAISHAIKGEYIEAISLLNQVITSEEYLSATYTIEVDYHFYINRGDFCRGLHNYNGSINDYNKAYSIHPNDETITTRLSISHYCLAVEAFNNGSYGHTESLLDSAINFNSNVFDFYLLRGRARYYGGDFTKAHEDFTQAHLLNPNSAEVFRYYFQFKGASFAAKNEMKNSDVSSLVITSGTILPNIKEHTIEQKIPNFLSKSKRQVKHIRQSKSCVDLVILEGKQKVVENMRKSVYSKDENLWSMMKSSSLNNSFNSNDVKFGQEFVQHKAKAKTNPPDTALNIGSNDNTFFASSSIRSSKASLRDLSRSRSKKAMKDSEKLLVGIRTYVETPPDLKVLGYVNNKTFYC